VEFPKKKVKKALTLQKTLHKGKTMKVIEEVIPEENEIEE
jgi:hypothetical protein